MEGLADRQTLNLSIIQPMQLFSAEYCPECENRDDVDSRGVVDYVVNYLLATSQFKRIDSFDEMVDLVMTGESAILIDGVAEAIVTEVKSWANRGIQEPQSEVTIRGPKEGSLRLFTTLRSCAVEFGPQH